MIVDDAITDVTKIAETLARLGRRFALVHRSSIEAAIDAFRGTHLLRVSRPHTHDIVSIVLSDSSAVAVKKTLGPSSVCIEGIRRRRP